ncbi:acetylglutamate kinase [Ureibacillus manganicus]|uniref:Acetylglutamate kinase n=1 Tax=Ureibacillus manganicus DSM 26584 TaxID=1384049 RepID=A0A0A3HY47_9BACL|nr:acetylglutamate kinase [Ureibacillus manganicus]KGR77536.1 acetyl-L-glutamate 5-phosphotransferase [Ureibacillus manganicus DSM 26584]
MTTYKSTHPTARKIIVIKLGGSTLEGLNEAFFSNFKKMQEQGYDIIITHGGGPAINNELAKQQVESHTLNGIRVTNESAIGIVASTLIAKVNPKLVYELNKAGISAIGLSGFDQLLLHANYLDKETFGYVGEVVEVNTQLLKTLLSQGIIPVIACIGVTMDGQALNINGDTVASAVALAVEAESLLLVTDVAGIRINDKFQTHATPSAIEKWIDEGHIFGGMIPKVQGAIQVLEAGVPSVQIVNDSLIGTNILSQELSKVE